MELINYLTQIIVSVIIFTIICFLGEQLITRLFGHNEIASLEESFPKEEILSLKQVYYLILILLIYICIINFFFDKYFAITGELFVINCLIDIIISAYIAITIYDSEERKWRRILVTLFLFPLASISSLLFGQSLLLYWDFIRIPTLLYVVVYIYNEFLEFTDENNLGKLILILISIIFTCLVLTIFIENQNPINALGMVSNAFTSNGYTVLGESVGGVLTSTFLVWSGYILSGVATATLAAEIVHRNSKKKFERLENKIDNLEKLLEQYQDNESEDVDE